jgi:hypothetical protein
MKPGVDTIGSDENEVEHRAVALKQNAPWQILATRIHVFKRRAAFFRQQYNCLRELSLNEMQPDEDEDKKRC